MPRPASFALVACTLATGLSAQQLFPLGEPITLPDGVRNLTLPFAVDFYDLSANQITVTKNGRVLPRDDFLTPNPIPSSAEFFSTPMICPYWANLEYVGPFGPRIFYDETATTATVTWQDVRPVGSSQAPGTFQVRFVDGLVRDSIVCVYDGPIASFTAPALVGINGEGSPGFFTAQSDLSQAIGGSISTPNDFLYQVFSLGSFDLVDTSSISTVSFSRFSQLFPQPFDVAQATGSTSLRGAQIERGREACDLLENGVSYTFTRALGSGPYRYRVDPGLLSGAVDSDYRRGLKVPIGAGFFVLQPAFPLPIAGVDYPRLWVSENGICVPTFGATTDYSNLTQAQPSVSLFHAGSRPRLAPLWCDFDGAASESLGGAVYVHQLADQVSITWENWLQEGHTRPNTFQMQIFSWGRIVFTYGKVDIVDAPDGSGFWNDALIGVSTGVVSAPSFVDYSSLSATSIPGSAVTEFFSATSAANPNPFDLEPLTPLPSGIELVFPNAPQLGSTFSVDAFDPSGAAIGAAYFFGLPSGLLAPPLPLDAIPGLRGCELVGDLLTPGATIAQATGTPGVPTPLLTIPNVPSLSGIRLSVSALLVRNGPGVVLAPTDEWRVVVGI
jgi:hypothetical protein